MWLSYFSFLLLSFYVVRENRGELISDENQAWEFLRCRDETLINRCEAGGDFLDWDVGTSIHDFAWQNFTDPLLRRAFRMSAEKEKIRQRFKTEIRTGEFKKRRELYRAIDSIYLNGGACVYHQEEQTETHENCTLEMEDEISKKILNRAGREEERKYYWVAWRNSVGRMRSLFDELLKLYKETDYQHTFIQRYQETSPSILEDVDRAFQEILPLYKELHAYVRRRLIGVYGKEAINSNGPIPSHLLGLTEGDWMDVKGVALPYGREEFDIIETLKKKNMKTIDFLKLGDDFYNSIGLQKIDDDLWNNTKTLDENCSANVGFSNSCTRKITGMSACIPVGEVIFHRIIGYMLVTYTYLPYTKDRLDWPWMFHSLSNPAFTPGLIIAAELSTWTNEYLALKGFEPAVPKIIEHLTDYDMNALMKVALRILPILPYLYRDMKWRWDSYGSEMSNLNYNKKWWKYSLEYQGVCPPVRRTEENFDPASSYRTAFRVPMLREFIGTVYGFQFYKAACDEIGHKDFLHRCSLYGKKSFGDKIRNILYLGNSVPPPEALSVMTNGASDKMDTKPLLDYFQPLYELLRYLNENETIGWESNDPMVCP